MVSIVNLELEQEEESFLDDASFVPTASMLTSFVNADNEDAKLSEMLHSWNLLEFSRYLV